MIEPRRLAARAAARADKAADAPPPLRPEEEAGDLRERKKKGRKAAERAAALNIKAPMNNGSSKVRHPRSSVWEVVYTRWFHMVSSAFAIWSTSWM